MAGRTGSRSAHVLNGFLEGISRTAFDYYRDQITELAGNRSGVYALYKDARLYYVGLAVDLRRRVRQHLNNRHGRKWNRFSLYLVRNDNALRELEALITRIARPRGNRQRGRLPADQNKLAALKQKAETAQKHQLDTVLGSAGRGNCDIRPDIRRRSKSCLEGVLMPLLRPGRKLRASYRIVVIEGRVTKDGRIRISQGVFASPSAAARAAVGVRINGWSFWTFRGGDGKWRPIDALRRRRGGFHAATNGPNARA
jgi:ribosomal protein S16